MCEPANESVACEAGVPAGLTCVAGPVATKLSDGMFTLSSLPADTGSKLFTVVEYRRLWKHGSNIDSKPMRFVWDAKRSRLRAILPVNNDPKCTIINGTNYDVRVYHEPSATYIGYAPICPVSDTKSSVTYIGYGADGYVCEMSGHYYNNVGEVIDEVSGFELVAVTAQLYSGEVGSVANAD